MSYYFKVNIITPIEDQGIFLDKILEKEMLNEVNEYVQDKTIKGVPVKFRISIFKKEENTKVMSVTINTKNINETDIIKLLSMRVSDNDILKFLSNEQNIKVVTNESVVATSQLVDHDKKSHELPVESVEVDYYEEEENEEELQDEIQDEIQEEKSQEKIKKVELKQPQIKVKKGLNKGRLITIGAIAFLGVSLFSQQLQLNSLKKENENLLQKTSQLTKKSEYHNEITNQVDTFGRFFLTYFYSEEPKASDYQDNIASYIDEDLKINDWTTPNKTLKSVHFYGISKENVKKGTGLVSYVVITADKKGSKQELISFDIKKHKDTFKVISKPTTKPFSFKE